jgi:pSer/pThr/pTyr-binding forkhead associated (FHA) protein
VAETHASIRTSGDHSEIESDGPEKTVLVNGRPTRHSRLRHGDQITIGRTSFLFQSKKG